MTPLRTQSKKTSRAVSLSRAFVPLSLTISTPIARPRPRVSPTIERSSHSFTRFRAFPPTRAARSGIRSRRMISIVTEDRAQGHQSAAEGLADRDEVRRDAEMLDPPHLARSTEPGLDLVRDEEPSVLVGELAKSAHEILRRDPDARLQGDRLEDRPRDAIRIGHVPEDLVLQESEAPLSELIVRHALRFSIGHRVRRMDGAAGEGLPVPSHARREGAKRGRSDAESVILSHEAQDERPTARLDRVLDGPFGGTGA